MVAGTSEAAATSDRRRRRHGRRRAAVALTAVVCSALLLPASAGAVTAPTGAAAVPTAAARPVLPGTNCPVFPADSWWHADVRRLPVHPRSRDWLRTSHAPTTRLHPDFGPSFGAQPVPYGIPVTVVDRTHPKVAVRFEYAAESDRVRYPLGTDTRIEGGAGASGDRHAIVVDRSTCRLYETWATRRVGGQWIAGSGATWDLRSNALRPKGWTSADAAGLPILPGLLRWDEVAAGHVDHAIRMTVSTTSRAFLWPARHQAGATTDPRYPPMGARFRLKASFDISRFSPRARVVLAAMRTYGLVVADNGSDWYFQGTADSRWPIALVDELKRIPASAFEAVDTSRLKVTDGSMATRR